MESPIGGQKARIWLATDFDSTIGYFREAVEECTTGFCRCSSSYKSDKLIRHACFIPPRLPLSIFVTVSVSSTHSFSPAHMHTQQEQLAAAAARLRRKAHVGVWTQRHDKPVELFEAQGDREDGDTRLSSFSRLLAG